MSSDAELTQVHSAPPLPLLRRLTPSQELASLRLLRATLESVKQLVDGVHTDTSVTTPANYLAVADLAVRWERVFKETSGGKDEKGKGIRRN
jgi:hypothetical protein